MTLVSLVTLRLLLSGGGKRLLPLSIAFLLQEGLRRLTKHKENALILPLVKNVCETVVS